VLKGSLTAQPAISAIDYAPANNGDTDFNSVQVFTESTSAVFEPGSALEDAKYTGEVTLGDIDADGDLALGDLNGDGSLDALLVTDQRFHIAMNDGSGRFQYSSSPQLTNVAAVALGDLDRDGDLDAVFAGAANSQSVWVNNGHGVFTRL